MILDKTDLRVKMFNRYFKIVDGNMDFVFATELWGLNESTLRKAIAYGKLVNGVDVCKFGKQWVVAIDSMQKECGNRLKKSNSQK